MRPEGARPPRTQDHSTYPKSYRYQGGFSWRNSDLANCAWMLLKLALFQDLVKEKTGQDKMQFIGFGMGVTAFIVTMNELPEYVDRVKG